MASNGDTYTIGREKSEFERLEEQHLQVTEANGFLIHPTIMARLPAAGVRVADVAAGTGAWARDVARKLAGNCHIVASDISPAQFPASSPVSNLTFTVADAKRPFPASQHGTFDFVHICALVGGLAPSEWELVMRNIVQLLKPGGSVQWSEGDWSTLRVLRSNTEYTPLVAFPKLVQKYTQTMGSRLTDAASTLTAVASSQLENVIFDIVSLDRLPELRARCTRQLAPGMLGSAAKIGAITPEERADLTPVVAAEIESGAYLRLDFVNVLGQKPLKAAT